MSTSLVLVVSPPSSLLFSFLLLSRPPLSFSSCSCCTAFLRFDLVAPHSFLFSRSSSQPPPLLPPFFLILPNAENQGPGEQYPRLGGKSRCGGRCGEGP
ncbi:unnamed protein product, partial [Ectocarpus fasciculatus]